MSGSAPFTAPSPSRSPSGPVPPAAKSSSVTLPVAASAAGAIVKPASATPVRTTATAFGPSARLSFRTSTCSKAAPETEVTSALPATPFTV